MQALASSFRQVVRIFPSSLEKVATLSHSKSKPHTSWLYKFLLYDFIRLQIILSIIITLVSQAHATTKGLLSSPNLPELEREATPFFSLQSGISLGLVGSTTIAQSNLVSFGGFSWEDESFVTSSTVVSYKEHRDIYNVSEKMIQSTNLGASEILWKSKHLGIRFHGLTVGYHIRTGISDITQSGSSIFINLFRRPTVRLDVHTGYGYENFQINGVQQSRYAFPQGLRLLWHTNRFSGQWKAEFRLYTPWENNSWVFETDAWMRIRIVTFDPIQFSIRLDLSYLYQPFVHLYRISPHSLMATLGIEVRI